MRQKILKIHWMSVCSFRTPSHSSSPQVQDGTHLFLSELLPLLPHLLRGWAGQGGEPG